MNIRRFTKSDFDYLFEVFNVWWERDVRHFLHPLFLYQLGNTALVAEDNQQIVGFLSGLKSQTVEGEAYIHLIATSPQHRRRGIARSLYHSFFAIVSKMGCQQIRAITLPTNQVSYEFHRHLGFNVIEKGAIYINGIWAIPHYSGPGQHRVVFEKKLSE